MVQPLGHRALARDDDVHVVAAAEAVVEDRQQAVRVGRQVDADDAGFLVDDVVEEAGVLVGEAVVILLPDMGGEQVIQRGDIPPPRQLRGDLQPLGVLVEHRVDDVDERLVAVEQAVPAGQQVALEPAFALVLAEHRVQHPSGGSEELVTGFHRAVPLAAGDLEDRAQHVRESLIGAEDPEVTLVLVQPGHVAQELAQDEGVLGVYRARRRHVHRVAAEVGHPQVPQQQAAVGVRVGAHPPVALGRELSQVRDERASLAE